MRYLITFSYDGSSYFGYAKQPNKKTIQGVLEDVLRKINGEKEVLVSASGRTDALVHAINQKAHFDLDKKYDVDKLRHSLNSLLPKDIHVNDVKEVNNSFHARFDVIRKEYMYIINMGDYNLFERNFVYQYNKLLDIDKINDSLKYFIGEHNFKSFTKNDENKDSYIRTIFDINLEQIDNKLILSFSGNGFLRYMVRNIVGTLINVGEHKIKPSEIKEILSNEDRRMAGVMAPPEGLYLKNVFYE